MTDPANTDDLAVFLRPTHFVDSDHPDVVAYARTAIGDAATATERAVRLFYAVRDGLRYDPYSVSNSPEDYRASVIARRDRGFCVPKAILLVACARAVGIPARLGFADVRNHQSPAWLREVMGTDVFVFHGYVEFNLDGRWIKATPAFDEASSRKAGVLPVTLDGTNDAMLHPVDPRGHPYIEYLRDRGSYVDCPVDEIRAEIAAQYGGAGS